MAEMIGVSFLGGGLLLLLGAVGWWCDRSDARDAHRHLDALERIHERWR